MSSAKNTSKIAVVGAGEVGSTIAYSLILKSVAGDILLVDPQETFRDAQVQDLSDATYHGDTSVRIRAGTHKDAGQCDIVVMTAGAKQKQGESRTDLIGRNLSILKSAIDDMKPFKKDTVLLMVANPVDVLTHFAQKYSGLPRSQVIGSGTFLDSARLRGILAEKTEVSADSIDAYVLGEHGESQFVAWSTVTIGGIPLSKVIKGTTIYRDAIAQDTKDKATAIMENKGATAYGIGGVTASICNSILFEQKNIRPISHYQQDLGCSLSMPAVLGRKGIMRTIPVPLDDEEQKNLKKSVDSLKEIIQDAEKSDS